MVELGDERDAMGVGARHDPEQTHGAGHGVRLAGQSELDEVGRIEVRRVRCKRRRSGMLDALVHGQDREIPGPRQPPRVVQLGQITQNLCVAVGLGKYPVDEIRPRQVEVFLRNPLGVIGQQRVGLVAEHGLDVRQVGSLKSLADGLSRMPRRSEHGGVASRPNPRRGAHRIAALQSGRDHAVVGERLASRPASNAARLPDRCVL